ncbi:MAG: putative toxin-antitoxin system toxin component, PIN family [Phycisphaerae bacterium]|nr:putative toxin-antitoxin system toxin component, PIN family [Saprospiraceae bacterium]
MKVVVDTNVMLAALPKSSTSHIIFLELLRGSYSLCITNDILSEYEEIFRIKANQGVATLALDVLDILPNLLRINKYFFWNLITVDPDDNKFVDCAVSANADFIVTDDKHFNVLKKVHFPVVRIISSDDFIEMLLNQVAS